MEARLLTNTLDLASTSKLFVNQGDNLVFGIFVNGAYKEFATGKTLLNNDGTLLLSELRWYDPSVYGEIDNTICELNKVNYVNKGSVNSLGDLQVVSTSKGQICILIPDEITDAIKELPAPMQKVLSEIPENFKLLHPTKDEISIFSKVGGEVTEIAKIEGSVLKIVDERILSKLSATEVEKLTQDILDNPKLLKAMGDEPGLASAWKKRGDLHADDVLRKNPGALDALSKPKSSRPDPSTYLDAKYIDDHLKKFDDGAIRFTSRTSFQKYGTIGPDGGFVMPKSEFDALLDATNGKLRAVETKLGLKEGYLGDGDTMIVLIEKQNMNGIRMPSGNEGGADVNLWIPGGKTSGGVSEAVMDFSAKPPFTEIFLK